MLKVHPAWIGVAALCSAAFVTLLPGAPSVHKTQNVLFVMTDGMRWQEIFRGADPDLLNKENGGIENPEPLKHEFWRDDPQERRRALMPFLWDVVARKGQLFGNRTLESDAYVTNGLNFSYPGYSETFCGFPDPRINSNDKVPNPNITVFEWLNHKPAFHDRIAAFGAWDVFPFIINAPRAGIPVIAGHDPLNLTPSNDRIRILNRLKQETEVWDDEAYDSFTFHTALEYLKIRKPRVLYLSLGETDNWAHEGKYDLYLHAGHRVDAYLRELWETAQSMPEYRDRTTLIVSVDHGRGEAPTGWKNHGEKEPNSKYMWMAFLGPDTPALGERKSIPAVTQSQIASTLAAALGQDYNSDVPNSGKPISDVLK
jgi:hypothetical protein